MARTHRVGRARRADGEWRHAGAFVGVVGADASEVQEVAGPDVGLATYPREHVEDLGRLVGLVARGDRRVRREHDTFAHAHQRVVDLLVRLSLLARELQGGERGVPFVQVDHGRIDAELAQHARAADTEERVLREADPVVAVVEARGDPPADGGVDRERGVEEVQRNPTDIDPPHVRDDVLVPDRARSPRPARRRA